MDKSERIGRIAQDPEDRLLLARVLDKFQQTEQKNIPAATCFLSPREQNLAVALLNSMGVRDGYMLDGGYEEAERRILVFLPEWADSAEDELRFIRADFPKQEPVPSHRDLLGSLMGLGIVRERLGDILVSERSADVIASPSLADYLLENWISAGRTHLKVRPIERQELLLPQLHTEELRITVSALRLDAVVSAAFHVSRSKALELIRAGRVSLDHEPCEKPDRLIGEGSLISARGLGRIKLASIQGETKKGRISIILTKYL